MKKNVLILAVIMGAFLGMSVQSAEAAQATQAQPAAQAAQPATVQPAAQAAQPATVQPVAQTAQPATVQPAAQAAQPAAPAKKESPNMVFCLCRGFVNIGTGWLELPRCMFYDNCMFPILGLIIGIPEGAGYTVARTFCGVMDLLTFGTMGNAWYGEEIFPNFVFTAHWAPPKK